MLITIIMDGYYHDDDCFGVYCYQNDLINLSSTVLIALLLSIVILTIKKYCHHQPWRIID